MSHSRRQPSYRYHKARNCAVVTIDGRNHYLGSFDSPESHQQYARLIAEWLSRRSPPLAGLRRKSGGHASLRQPPQDSAPLSVNELLLAYWRHAEQHYSTAGKPTKELVCMKHAIRPLKELYGLTPAIDFGPRALKAVRQHMVEKGLCRRVVNARVNRIRRVFKWAVSEELVPASVHEGLRTVSGLQYGRTAARESEPVRPVDTAAVEAVLPFVTPTLSAMIRLQLLTGMRACEVVLMRPCDVDRTGEVWLYRPSTHKTQHLGHDKVVPLGPHAQEVLQPFLGRAPEEYLFSPQESESFRNEHRAVHRKPDRKTKIYPSELRARELRKAERAGRKSRRPKRASYDVDSYRRAITYGIKKARRAGVEVPHWHPHQLRHTRATEIRRRYGLEGAQVVLGHQSAEISQIYAERDLGLAVRIAREIG